jgi:hypothetical protein
VEILACHRIIDEASLLLKGPSSHAMKPSVVSPGAAEAQASVFSELFRGKASPRSFSSVLQSLKVTMTQFMNQPRAIMSRSSVPQTCIQVASSLAKSATQYRDQAHNSNALFNIEMTAALVRYIVAKVCSRCSELFQYQVTVDIYRGKCSSQTAASWSRSWVSGN